MEQRLCRDKAASVSIQFFEREMHPRLLRTEASGEGEHTMRP